MDRQLLFTLLRFYFIGLNGLIIISGIVLFYLGNIDFNKKNIDFGSFIGGKMASTSIVVVIYGALGAYGAIKRERVIINIYASIAAVSLITRLFLWVLVSIHGVKLEAYNYTYVGLELTNILMSVIFNYFNSSSNS